MHTANAKKRTGKTHQGETLQVCKVSPCRFLRFRLKGVQGDSSRIFSFLFLLITVYCLLPTGVAHASLIQPPNNLGLVGYWSFNEGNGTVATDFSGNGNNGTLTNGPTWVNGKRGKALNFDGSDDYIDVGNGASLRPSTAISICSWFLRRDGRVPSGANEQDIIVRSSTAIGGNYLLEFQNDGAGADSITFDVGGGSNFSYLPFSSVLVHELDKWIHLCATYSNGGSASFYVNGQYVAPGVNNSETANIPTNVETVYIGGKPSGGDNTNGKIDEVRIYNRALSATEVSALYNSKAAVMNAVSNGGISGLVGYWPLDGSTTNWATGVTSDVSGNGNNGTMIGMSTSTSAILGKIGQALSFERNQRVTNGDVTIFDGLTEVTCSAWIYVDSRNSGFVSVLRKDGSITCLQLPGAENTWNTVLWAPTVKSHSVVVPASAMNRWVHFTVRWSASYGAPQIFLDGEYYSDMSVSTSVGSITNSSAPLVFGATETGTETFLGRLDDIRFYNRYLSATEIRKLYNKGATKFNASNKSRMTDGLVGYWTMDGADTNWATGVLTDSSGTGNNGNLVGMSTTTSPTIGKIGQAFNFLGGTDYVKIGAPSAPITDMSSWTVSAWVYYTSAPVNSQSLIYVKGSSFNAKKSFFIDNTASKIRPLSAYVSTTGTPRQTVTNDNAVPLNQWTFVITSYTSGDGGPRIYVNGVEASYASRNEGTGSNTSDSGNEIDLGNRLDVDSGMFGKIDEVRVYNRALSATEITSLYIMGR